MALTSYKNKKGKVAPTTEWNIYNIKIPVAHERTNNTKISKHYDNAQNWFTINKALYLSTTPTDMISLMINLLNIIIVTVQS